MVAWFSRRREFRADAGSAQYAGREKMIAALEALQRIYGKARDEEPHESVASLKISGSSTKMLFSTHPPLKDRIAALKSYS